MCQDGQVCHTGGLWDYLPSFLQRASSPIVELLSDDARGLLYARTAASEVSEAVAVPACPGATCTLCLSICQSIPAGSSIDI